MARAHGRGVRHTVFTGKDHPTAWALTVSEAHQSNNDFVSRPTDNISNRNARASSVSEKISSDAMAPPPRLAAVSAASLDEDEACALLLEHGCFVVTGVVPKAVCECALAYVNQRMLHALTQCGQTSTADFPKGAGQHDDPAHVDASSYHFGDVLAPPHRRDLKLPLDSPVRHCVGAALRVLKPILANTLTPDAQLCELSCLVSDPNAAAQRLHPDTPIAESGFNSHCALLTVFVALQDITCGMGATEVVPGTHCAAAHVLLNSESNREENKKLQALRAGGFGTQTEVTLSTGDVFVMDSRLVHRGGANSSENRRALLYSSFAVPNNAPGGSTYSLLDELAGGRKFRVSNLETWCGC
jgi:ectoine hydroxylase-related dioxygenase (phytanoyl-CoA dioxygenase family)